ncbi:phage tail tape measure protein [Mycobacterium sp. PSTR-4-N]|uniref:phage tail tape measure protein n=1 Tax=Mycobacterium sp. PSTR-4-N TaxID=2917745 RepID=UPI0027DF2DFB|nr:phage tail tape measure protein [Mycobacterium sp. PSTR-4-N]
MPLTLRIESELDERSAAAAASRAQRIYSDAARDMSRDMSEGIARGAREGGRAVERMADEARAAYKRVGDATDELRQQEAQLKQMREEGVRGVEVQMERVRRARKAEKDAIREAADEYERYERAARGAGQAGEQAGTSILAGLRGATAGAGQSGGDMANEFASGFAGSSALLRLGAAGGPVGLAIAGVAALGYAGGKALADQIMAGLETLQMRDLFRAKLGVDETTMAGYGDAAAKAYVNQFGASVEDNLRATEVGIKSGLIDRDATDAEIQGLIQQIQTVSTVIGEDTARVAQGSRNLIKTGLVDNYEQAFDLLTAASQKGLDISGDLLDTAEEYGTAWQAVGLTGADAMGLIDQMWQAGIRNTDVAADSLKELSINLTDGSKTTADTMTALGFNAEDMMNRFAQGGPVARDAFGEVLTALRNIDDPVQKNLIGLNLFKTKWEDAKTAIEAADLSKAASDLGQIDGATRNASDAVGEHANQWVTLGRNIDDTFTRFQTWLADSKIGKFFTEWLPSFVNSNLFPGDPLKDFNDKLPKDAFTPAAPDDGLLSGGAPAPAGPMFPGANVLIDPRVTAATPGPPPVPPPGPQDGGPQRVTPVPLTPGSAGGASTSLPDAPVLPMSYTSTAGLPTAIANAVTRLDEVKHDVAEKTARVNQLEQSNVATADDIQKAKNEQAKAQQDQLQAERALTDAQTAAIEKQTKQLKGTTDSLSELGAGLDSDFGISKGLSGIADNIVRFVGSLALAGPMAQLNAISQARGDEGSGLMGILASNGVLGPRFMPGYGSTSVSGSVTTSLPSGAAMPLGAALPGESPREFAHRVMMPYWESKGLTVGDHAADQYGEHQNGALDIMVPDIATGNAVLQQVLSDPNVYGAIFNNQAFGYGQGAAPRPYSGGFTGDPTQDHQDHVHAFYKPGGSDNINPGGVPVMGGDGAYSPVGVTSGVPSSSGATPVFVVNMPGGGGFPGLGAGGAAVGSPASGRGGGALPGAGAATNLWDAVAAAESSGNWGNQDTGGNGHYGGLQFSPDTWRNFGGVDLTGFTNPADATREQQIEIANRTAFTGYNGQAPQGLGAWQAITDGRVPGVTTSTPASAFGGPLGPLPPVGSVGAGESAPLGVTGQAYPSQGGGGGGIGISGSLMGAVTAAASAFPGGGAAAQMAMQLINRTVQYAGQVAGIGISGLAETFLPAGDKPKASIGNSWLGKIAGGIAGAKPAVPNAAGGKGKQPPGPMDAAGGAAGGAAGAQAGNTINNTVNQTNHYPTQDIAANSAVREMGAMYAAPGVR